MRASLGRNLSLYVRHSSDSMTVAGRSMKERDMVEVDEAPARRYLHLTGRRLVGHV